MSAVDIIAQCRRALDHFEKHPDDKVEITLLSVASDMGAEKERKRIVAMLEARRTAEQITADRRDQSSDYASTFSAGPHYAILVLTDLIARLDQGAT